MVVVNIGEVGARVLGMTQASGSTEDLLQYIRTSRDHGAVWKRDALERHRRSQWVTDGVRWTRCTERRAILSLYRGVAAI